MPDAYVLAVFKARGRTADKLIRPPGGDPLRALEQFVKMTGSGNLNVVGGFTVVDDSGTLPEGSITVDTAGGAPADGETITFTLFGATAVLTVGVDFPASSDGPTLAQSLGDAIAQHPQIGSMVDVIVGGSIVGLIGRFPGDLMENISMSTSDAVTFTVSNIGVDEVGVDGAATKFPEGRQFYETGT